MKRKRIFLHGIFWLAQFSVSLYNELYTSASFSRQPSLELFLQTATAVLLLLLVKMAVAYYVLYTLIPKWIKAPARLFVYAETLLLLFVATLVMRFLTQIVVWRLIFGEGTIELSFQQTAARYFYSLLDLLQVVGIASAIKLFKLRMQAMQKEKVLVQEKLRSEILHLKSQVNPHFLFNTLNSIYSLSRAGSALAPDAIMRLSKILRYMLYETSQKTVSVLEELKIIDDYIELQQLRFGQRLKVVLHKELDASPSGITPLLLLPLVENAFKHGSEGGTIAITLEVRNSQLFFEVTNPLAGSTFRPQDEEGIGLVNIARQLELLYRNFSLKTGEKEGNFMVTLNIDLSTYAGFELFDSRR